MAEYADRAWRQSMRIRFEFGNMMADSVGVDHGVAPADVDGLADRCRAAGKLLQSRRGTGMFQWMNLPYQAEQTTVVDEIENVARSATGRFDSFVVLGIGGSALGNIAIHSALTHPFYNLLASEKRGHPRIFVLDNVDPDLVSGFLDTVDPSKTLFNVITKSGSTAETMSQLLVFRRILADRLGAAHRDNVIATTDASHGDLRKIADAEGYRAFVVPDGVGGRFSVLSPVGLLSAAVAGIDVRGLLAGAAFADELCREPDVWRNPASMNAVLQFVGYRRGRKISVFMPYSQALRYLADWYRQLWAESLGKHLSANGEVVDVGPTPLSALGVTDQHSMLQLFQEGPYDKVINFVAVERFAREVTIPPDYQDLAGTGYLGDRTLNELIAAEQRGVEIALTAAGRPSCRHVLPEINAFTVGQLIYMLEMQTAYAGELLGIDTYDQPGVEGGKIATYALMGRDGFEAERAKIEARPATNSRYAI